MHFMPVILSEAKNLSCCNKMFHYVHSAPHNMNE